MIKLTFYGGVNEIGGNKILLQDKKTRGLFDFGQSFTFGADYFTGYLTPRAVNGLGDYFAFGLLPRIEGLYSKEMLTYCNLPYCQPKIDAVFLSHAHFDHVSHIQFLDPDIPVYMGYGTKLFMESMEETSSFTVTEPFPTTLVATASIASVAIVVVGLLFYFKKRKH